MGKAILFRWEDSDALKHHCGFCERPLSHPTAKTSCFGTHAEPCHRFHQMMFMRNRGHTCDMCSQADEHHYKRHANICDQIRSIYESCSEDWSIIPDEEENRGRSRSRSPNAAVDGNHLPSASRDTLSKKKEKKEQKRQARAASRSKVTTQNEINYIDSVVHSESSQNDHADPNNPSEIEEIEQHLRYNAQCYNHGEKRRDIKQFGHISDADIDFETEIDRILDVFRVTELVKRNHRNRGLRNKELANFQTLVAQLKEQIISDLMFAKRDELETRMRRAAFLRFTNRAGYDIVADRYTDKDWKTGEKIRPEILEASSPDGLTALAGKDETDGHEYTKPEDDIHTPIPTMTNTPDRRHIELSHKKLSFNGLLEEVTPIKPATTAQHVPTRMPSLRILDTDTTPPKQISFGDPWTQQSYKHTRPIPELKLRTQKLSGSSTKDSSLGLGDEWPTFTDSQVSPQTSMNNKDAQAAIDTAQLSRRTLPSFMPPLKGPLPPAGQSWADKNSLSLNSKFPSPVHKNDQNYVTADEENHLGLFTRDSLRRENSINQSHAPVESRKKKDKKKQREAERKSRRASEKKSAGSLYADPFSGDTEVDSPSAQLSPTGTLSHGFLNNAKGGPSETPYRLSEGDLEAAKEVIGRNFTPFQDLFVDSADEDQAGEMDSSVSDDAYLSSIAHEPPTLTPKVEGLQTQSVPVPASKSGRHGDWIKFLDFLKVDTTSGLIFMPDHPAYGNRAQCSLPDCQFEASGIPDCPYHKTYCQCIDPLNPHNEKVIVYADAEPFHIGPFNYIQGEKLMSFFAAQPETKNRLMLLTEDLCPWLYGEGRDWQIDKIKWNDIQHQAVPKNIPTQLVWEVDEYFRGYPKGSALKQIDYFQQLAARNARLNDVSCHPAVTKETLEAMHKEFETGPEEDAICYCKEDRPTSPDNDEKLIQCAHRDCRTEWFHRVCIEKLGYDRVTTWYCASCERLMKEEARKATPTFWAKQSSKPQPVRVGSHGLHPILHAGASIARATVIDIVRGG